MDIEVTIDRKSRRVISVSPPQFWPAIHVINGHFYCFPLQDLGSFHMVNWLVKDVNEEPSGGE